MAATTGASIQTFLDHPFFNRTFILPPNPLTGRTTPFKASYCDYGYHNPSDPSRERVLLHFGPLMATRLLHVAKHFVAARHHIRIIDIDRPGFGGTDAIPTAERMAIWREVVPALLTSLSIAHLSAITAHSGGTVYAVDFLLSHPSFLLPTTSTTPTLLALGAPWILPSRSSATAAWLTQQLPSPVLRQADAARILVERYVDPVVGVSTGFSGAIGRSMRVISGSLGSVAAAPAPSTDEEMAPLDAEGGEWSAARQFELRVISGLGEKISKEGAKGLGEEAVVLMYKEGAGGWGDWGDYDVAVPRVVEGLRAAGRRLEVRVFWAEKDMMVGDAGTKGPRWFAGCWRGGWDEVLEYGETAVEGADHDTIWDLHRRSAREVYGRVGWVGEEGEEGGS
ncbi:hypothetical protein B0T18DRAFT_333978 [Schizothecium vesticola]|uniref:AB hydrolase-1 domain-containing protein n=1 Tax=Schizothecium vesticola TaxID=314040 RepID=A0AA40EHV0_9PEZI|nr:hypothetical protein B0T18DRAFT_333978 [Schizothecium vesticola]